MLENSNVPKETSKNRVVVGRVGLSRDDRIFSDMFKNILYGGLILLPIFLLASLSETNPVYKLHTLTQLIGLIIISFGCAIPFAFIFGLAKGLDGDYDD